MDDREARAAVGSRSSRTVSAFPVFEDFMRKRITVESTGFLSLVKQKDRARVQNRLVEPPAGQRRNASGHPPRIVYNQADGRACGPPCPDP